MWIDSVWHGKPWTWEKIPWVIEQWKKISNGKPFCLKGIQSVEDARLGIYHTTLLNPAIMPSTTLLIILKFITNGVHFSIFKLW